MPQGYSKTKYIINYKRGGNGLKGKSGEDEVRSENSIDKILAAVFCFIVRLYLEVLSFIRLRRASEYGSLLSLSDWLSQSEASS